MEDKDLLEYLGDGDRVKLYVGLEPPDTNPAKPQPQPEGEPLDMDDYLLLVGIILVLAFFSVMAIILLSL